MTPAAVRGMRAAFVFMTRLPAGGFPYAPEAFRWAPAHFPLVGIAVGALAALVLVLAAPLGPFVSSILSVATLVSATGALHEDGLADTADALGGHHDRARILEILKDSRIGSYGACALGLSLLLRTACLSELVRVLGTGPFDTSARAFGSAAMSAPGLLIVSQCLSRTGPVCLMVALAYVSGENAKSSAVTHAVRAPQLAVALGWVALCLALATVCGMPLVLSFLLAATLLIATGLLGRWFHSRVRGYTGDFLGATQQVLDASLLLAALAFASWTQVRA
jgi:adenosylcobinamide-GDP ribazoletransferase